MHGSLNASSTRRLIPPPLPELLRLEWQRSSTALVQDAIQHPAIHPGTGARIHLLRIKHGDPMSACHVTKVLDAVQPDRIALELQPAELRKAVRTTAQGVSPAIKQLLQIQGPYDYFHLISDAEAADWNRRVERAVPWTRPMSARRALQGSLHHAEHLSAILWAHTHRVRVEGIDVARGEPQERQQQAAAAALAAQDVPRMLLDTIKHSPALHAAGALRWWRGALEQAPDDGEEGAAVAGLASNLLTRALPWEDFVRYEQLQRRAAPAAYARLVDERDAVMARRLGAMCSAGTGRFKGRPPARRVVAVVGFCHAHGIQQLLARMAP